MVSRDRAPLIEGLSQFEVDFVIPRVGVDVPVGIDPFLLYKSRDPSLRALHDEILVAFNSGIEAVKRGDYRSAHAILDFPEVAEIGLGYTRAGKRGSGIGTYLRRLILETLAGSEALLERGVRHVEEMQLLSAGIGPDRVSDISANLLKHYLIEYTQRQAEIWRLPLTRDVPIQHIYVPDTRSWTDGYFDLPTSPLDKSPILLVPRRIVRALPWINYDDFLRTEFKAYLAARREVARRERQRSDAYDDGVQGGKGDVTLATRADLALVERYVRSKEQSAADALPSIDYIDEDACAAAERLKGLLHATSSGREHASNYQTLVLEILNFLFNPDLADGEPEVRTIDGTERRDIIFTNESDEPFWSYLRTDHSSLFLMFEVKNTESLGPDAMNQTATYLGDRLGTLGVIVTRKPPSEAIRRKAASIWNDSAPKRKAILILSDADLVELLDIRCKGGSTSKWMQRRYREFRMSLQ